MSTLTVCNACDALNKIDSAKALTKTPVCGKCGKEIHLHGLVSEVNADQLKRIVAKSDKPVIVDFWASWCGPCKTYGPEFESASKQNDRAVFLKVNTEANQRLSGELGIRSIPCTIIYQGGKEVRRQNGAMNAQQINQLV